MIITIMIAIHASIGNNDFVVVYGDHHRIYWENVHENYDDDDDNDQLDVDNSFFLQKKEEKLI